MKENGFTKGAFQNIFLGTKTTDTDSDGWLNLDARQTGAIRARIRAQTDVYPRYRAKVAEFEAKAAMTFGCSTNNTLTACMDHIEQLISLAGPPTFPTDRVRVLSFSDAKKSSDVDCDGWLVIGSTEVPAQAVARIARQTDIYPRIRRLTDSLQGLSVSCSSEVSAEQYLAGLTTVEAVRDVTVVKNGKIKSILVGKGRAPKDGTWIKVGYDESASEMREFLEAQ